MTNEKLSKLETELYATQHKLKAKENDEKYYARQLQQLTRAGRTHRFCTRAGMLGMFLREPTLLTDNTRHMIPPLETRVSVCGCSFPIQATKKHWRAKAVENVKSSNTQKYIKGIFAMTAQKNRPDKLTIYRKGGGFIGSFQSRKDKGLHRYG